ncbi:hypothetical protein N7533_013180 [Penicillium manginii]|uniref:uncharacterized protein n=1 Tax=Penicillium manginii TaxID=203109 RepID=UPI002546EEB4|nr:uncharacterized protein N7533_013180 [Penicillium manginii]KAJ5734777.1 hypothetical protein N7533_013180 [Penicillium manginii]
MSFSSPVAILATHTVQGADTSNTTKLASSFPLGPFDHLLPPSAVIAVVFVWRRPLDSNAATSDPIISFDLLQMALSRLLDFYPHLTGRVHINDEDGSPEINQLGEGVELSEALCETSLPSKATQLSRGGFPDQGNLLLPQRNGSHEDFSRQPILSIQYTRFGCGSISLGVCISHSVCDAHGFVQLMEDLSEIYRGFRTSGQTNTSPKSVQPSQMPCITSHLSNVSLSLRESKKALSVKPVDYQVQKLPAVMSFTSNKPVTGKVLYFGPAELNALKHAASPSPQDHWVSTFEAISAHLWLSVQRARLRYRGLGNTAFDNSGETADLLTSLDWRESTRLKLPPRYFPNAVSEPFITLPLKDLSHQALPKTARMIHEVLRARTPKDQTETLSWVMAQPKKNHINLRCRFNERSFIISQWNKLHFYAVHFETDNQGKPVLPERVWPPFTETSLVDGLAYFLPTGSEVGGDTDRLGIDIALSLHEPIWDILEQDVCFRKFRR